MKFGGCHSGQSMPVAAAAWRDVAADSDTGQEAQFNSRGRHGLPREPIMQTRALVASAIAGVTLAMSGAFAAAGADDAGAVAALDTAYQAAVERNDWQAMDRILHPDFVLVLGNGKASDRRHLIDLARSQAITFEKQVELPGTQ